MIETRGLCKSFGDHVVLDGIDLEVAAGTIFALLGPNGAGKTTMINILTTLLKADAGSAQIYGYDIDRQGDKMREQISLTGQFAAVDEILTGRENLVMIAELRHKEPAHSVTCCSCSYLSARPSCRPGR